MVLFKKILSAGFLIVSIIIIFFVYLYSNMLIELLTPSFYDIIRFIIPAALLITAFWVFNKTYGLQPSKKTLVTLSLLVVILPFIYFGIRMYGNYSNSIFQQERWANTPEIRAYMVDDLLIKYEIKGMTRDEVIKLLGEPTDTGHSEKSYYINYYLGPPPGLLIGLDIEWLVIAFDNNGTVESYTITIVD